MSGPTSAEVRTLPGEMDRKTATAVTVDELKDIGKAKMRTTDELIKEIEKGEE